MSFILPDLGMQVGSVRPYTTTFADQGLLSPQSPFRRAWSYAEPTVLGMLAASFRLLRDPYVVAMLPGALAADGRSLLAHLTQIYATNIAIVFGDTSTAAHIKNRLRTIHRRKLAVGDQPEWLIDHLGEDSDISLGDERLMAAVMDAFVSAIARAHQACGLLQAASDEQYCRDANNSLGSVVQVSMPALSVSELHAMGKVYAGMPLMDQDTMREAGVPELLHVLLNSEVALPGVTVWTLRSQFLPLMWPEDREALELNFTREDQEQFDSWAAAYAERVKRHAAIGDVFDESDFFTASRGRVVYS